MLPSPMIRAALVILAGLGSMQPLIARAAPPTAELAKKCRELAVKAHPPVPAGSKKGTAQAERAYFQKCIANQGKMPEEQGQ